MLASKGLMASSTVEPIYVDDVFSTWLYTGNGSTQTITNGIDLSGKGGLVWTKARSNTNWHSLTDTATGANKILYTNSTLAQDASPNGISSFNTTGYTIGSAVEYNQNSVTFASWTFRKAPKFFDVVTYTGNGTSDRAVAHSLGSVPGMIIVKRTDIAGDWYVYHRGMAATNPEGLHLLLNSTAATSNLSAWDVPPTSTNFYVQQIRTNIGGATYVAYLFAHDAGGFGESGTDSAVSCGSYTGTGTAGVNVNLGFEPQWLMVKSASNVAGWYMQDIMRGFLTSGTCQQFFANTSEAENDGGGFAPTATGFTVTGNIPAINESGKTYIYLAIRRPNKPPTSGTQVFAPVAYTGTNVDNRLVTTNILTDMTMARIRATTSTGGFYVADRLRGNASLGTAITDAENTDADSFMTPTVGYGNSFSAMSGFGVGNDITRQLNQSVTAQLAYAFKRAPGFFDVVCYTGTGVARTVAHNLTVAPELIITKERSAGDNWYTYSAATGNDKFLELNSIQRAVIAATIWNNTSPTASVFSLGTSTAANQSGVTYVAYLFATLPGVSKVGSYTGTGTTNPIDCGFNTTARFVMIKRTDNDTGGWYVWDSARGILTGNEAYLLFNTTAAEVTGTDYIDPKIGGGFEISSTAPAEINASGGSYIFLAIA